MGGKADDAHDKRVRKLASDISTAKDTQIPRLLLQLQGILDSYQAGSVELAEVKLDIWKYDLLQVLLTTLKQDFSRLPQGWETCSKLCAILSTCCVGLNPSDSENFINVFLPNALDHLLILGRKLQNKYCKTSEVLEDTRNDLLGYMKGILECVTFMFGGHHFLTQHLVGSQWLLQMLITDDVETCVLVMSLLQSAARSYQGLFGEIEEQAAFTILDELIYKLSASEHPHTAGSATRTILCICDSHPPVVELLCTRYRGLNPLLNKWQGAGFGRDLRRLQQLLDAGSMKQANLERLARAAAVIQAWWRSYKMRKTIKRADRAIATFQRSFRKRKEAVELSRQQEKEKKELQHFVMRQRKQAMRSLHSKQLQTLEFLPADLVNRHLETEAERSATIIQKTWRGHMIRRSLGSTRDNVAQIRAAVKIQRCVRRWLARVAASRREPPSWQRPPGLTDDRRVQLQAIIMERREARTVSERSRSQQEELHSKVQTMLKHNTITSKCRRQQEQHRAALLARLEMDATLLMSAPSLPAVKADDLSDFVCHSVPVATKARHNHQQELRLLRQPWWKKLGDEYQDRKVEEEWAEWKVF